MTEAQILTSLNEVKEYLNLLEIDFHFSPKAHNITPNKYSDKYFQAVDTGNYELIYYSALENNDYDILLSDDSSFFQFSATKIGGNINSLRFAYYPPFKDTMSLDDFLNLYLNDSNEDTILNEYELYLQTNDKINYICPIRFDFSEPEYSEGTHAIAHLHIGFNTHIRIPISIILKPIVFVDFIIKHTFKPIWDSAYLTNNKFSKIVEQIKNSCENIELKYFTDREKKQLFII